MSEANDTPAIEIKSRSGRVLFVSHRTNVKAAVEEAVSQRADLEGACLEGAYLEGAYLRGAYLEGAYLQRADLRGAYLEGAYLRGAYLQGAYLRGADLEGAYLEGAYLRGADLEGAYLEGAYLRGAYLRGADLRGADLEGAYLEGAYLRGAYLRGADLRGAKNAELALAQASHLPEGDLLVYKKCSQGRIVKLRIPAEAKRSHASSRKCRAEYAEVVAITDSSGADVGEAFSLHDKHFKYEVGATVRPTRRFDENRWNECASGIHFYISREEASAHV